MTYGTVSNSETGDREREASPLYMGLFRHKPEEEYNINPPSFTPREAITRVYTQGGERGIPRVVREVYPEWY